jgi:hypothetical protein
MDTQDHPFAVAILTLDCSIILVRDLLADESIGQTLHFGSEGERAYRLLCAEGHVFLLTNRRLYAFVDLASVFLEGERNEGQVMINFWNIEAVDASVASDRSLLIVMPSAVYRIELDFLVSGNVGPENHCLATEMRTRLAGWESVTRMATFSSSPWEESESRAPEYICEVTS